jgi:DNA-binding NtrC family response regulator
MNRTLRALNRVADLVLAEVPSDRALFRVLGPDGETEAEVARGLDGANGGRDHKGEADLAIAGRVLEFGRPALVLDLAADPEFADLDPGGDGWPASVLSYPWATEGRPAGIAYLARDDARPAFTKQDLEFLTISLAPVLFLLKKNGSGDAGEGYARAGTPLPGKSPFLGVTPAVQKIRFMIDKIRDTDAPVFLWGESGTGKELVARTVHETGRRKGGAFVAVNCGAIPDSLLESELFGHARGSFTGAVRDKAGLIEEASGGTFFLDEIGDMPLALQSKILRVLEEKKIRRVGETRTRAVDVRFVSATNKDLEKEVARGRFREDLSYRLRIITIELPPLRDRKDDVLLLLDHFLDEHARATGRPRPFFSPIALEILVRYPWPGNVRELQNEVQRALIMAGDSPLIREDFLSPKVNPGGETYTPASHRFSAAKADFERRFLREALVRCGYHRTRTASEIGLTRQGLFKLLKKHRICPAAPKTPPLAGER